MEHRTPFARLRYSYISRVGDITHHSLRRDFLKSSDGDCSPSSLPLRVLDLQSPSHVPITPTRSEIPYGSELILMSLEVSKKGMYFHEYS